METCRKTIPDPCFPIGRGGNVDESGRLTRQLNEVKQFGLLFCSCHTFHASAEHCSGEKSYPRLEFSESPAETPRSNSTQYAIQIGADSLRRCIDIVEQG